MSKSRNNGVDPIEMFDKFGVDATRIYLASIATGADIKWNDLLIETYRNFANKIWNATRFCMMNSDGAQVDHGTLTDGEMSLADRWIISRLNRTGLDLNRSLRSYEFHTAVSLVYHFFWDDFCDWYIELVKDDISGEGSNELQRKRIITILGIALRMLHPFMPYLTEELWQKLPGISGSPHHPAYAGVSPSIMLTSFPSGDEQSIDKTAEREMSAVIDVIKRVRNIRSEMNISPSSRPEVHIAASDEYCKVFRANEAQILKLARAEKLVIANSLDVPRASAKAVTDLAEAAVPLEGLIDFSKERERLVNQIGKLESESQRLAAQLSNPSFVDRAPARKRFGFQNWLNYKSDVWDKLVSEALNNEKEMIDFPILGYDIDRQVISKAKSNARLAGVDHVVKFQTEAVAVVKAPCEKGIMITNPPYGARIGEEDNLKDAYKDLGFTMKNHFKNWHCWILSGNKDLIVEMKLKSSRRVFVYNGPIECRFLKYEMF